MNSKDILDKKKLLYKFGILYFATVATLITVFVVASGHENRTVADQSPAPDQVRAATVRAIDKANDLLGRHADKLRQLDGKYINVLTDSFNVLLLEDINGSIHTEETAFAKAIDSLELEGSPFTSLAAAFRNVLNDHLSVSGIRMSLPSGTKKPGNGNEQREMLLVRKELQEKDDRIALLQRRLQEDPENKNAGSSDGPDPVALQADNDALRQRLGDQVKTATTLKDQVSTLNNKLNEVVRSGEGSNTVLYNKNAALQRQTTELADELRFAQVDCNLSRADGRQVIYTAKQRKELLMDALATLNDLSKSQNADVQQKAKDRLGQLKSIAAAVHD